MNDRKTIILGGGLAGLSAAWHGGGTVYEKEHKCGGTCISPKVNGYTFDLGIHVLHTRDEYVLKLLGEDLKVDFLEQKREAKIYSFERLTQYPFQANTYGLPVAIVKDCLIGFVEAYSDRRANDHGDFANYEDWIIATFGEGVARHFMIPYSEKFWTVSPSDMTTDWLDVRIPMPSLDEVVEGALTNQAKGFGPNAIFRYPRKDGISAIPEAFLSSGIDVVFNKEATGIDLTKKEVSFSDGTSECYDTLIATIPLPELVRLAGARADIVKASEGLRCNSVLCVNLGIDEPALNENHWIYYPEEKYSFFRISFLGNFSSGTVPESKSSITAEISYCDRKEPDRDNIVDVVIKDLIDAKVINKDSRIELTDLRDIKYGYVIYDHNRKENVSDIKSFFEENSVFVAGRYGSWEYQWMDDAILDGKKAAEAAGRRPDRCAARTRIRGVD